MIKILSRQRFYQLEYENEQAAVEIRYLKSQNQALAKISDNYRAMTSIELVNKDREIADLGARLNGERAQNGILKRELATAKQRFEDSGDQCINLIDLNRALEGKLSNLIKENEHLHLGFQYYFNLVSMLQEIIRGDYDAVDRTSAIGSAGAVYEEDGRTGWKRNTPAKGTSGAVANRKATARKRVGRGS